MSECQQYCSHGGFCVLEKDHEEDHDSGFCQWAEPESLTKDQADAVLGEMPGGKEYIALRDTYFSEEER